MKEIERPDIEAVYDFYGLRVVGRGGAWRKAECPLPDHMDSNPSGSINPELGKWNCFSCDRRGDGLDIVMEREHLARLTDALHWCKENLAGGGRVVRPERVGGGGLSVRPGNHGGDGAYVPPWRRAI